MLKTRVIPVVLYNGQVVVKSIGFDPSRNIGSPVNIARVYNAREVDELVYLDINATRKNNRPDFDTVYEIAEECYMPLTVGGGIKGIEDFREALKAGADKISINSEALENPELVSDASKRFGSQCVVVSIDAKLNGDSYNVYNHVSRETSSMLVTDWAREVESLGAGEILLTSVDKDGTMTGYDTRLIKLVADSISLPVVVNGGVGDIDDFYHGTCAGASAVAASSIFHFTQHTPLEVKRYLAGKGVEVRL